MASTITLTDSARELIANMGYDPTYGARPLRRVIQKQLTDRLALALLEGELHEGDSVRVDAVDGELVFSARAFPRRDAGIGETPRMYSGDGDSPPPKHRTDQTPVFVRDET